MTDRGDRLLLLALAHRVDDEGRVPLVLADLARKLEMPLVEVQARVTSLRASRQITIGTAAGGGTLALVHPVAPL